VAAGTNSTSGTFGVELIINSKKQFISGLVGIAHITPNDEKKMKIISVGSIFNADKNDVTVFVYNELKQIVEKRHVRVADIYKNSLPIISGLNISDKVVVEGFSGLKNNMSVTVKH